MLSVPHQSGEFADRPGVLCVDDEPRVLEGLRDILRRRFRVRVATSGAEGLAALSAEPDGYALVVSDMRMPVMAGSVFLGEARRVAPNAVRVLLTGQADTHAAIEAVNDGQVFRFLTKPCEHEDLLRCCVDALRQHRLLVAEEVLLEQTLRGSIQALTGVLSLVSPAAFGRGSRVRRWVGLLAREVGMEDSWEVEVAAMVVHLGAVTLPRSTAERLYVGEPLSAAETAMAARVPDVTRRIMGSIPRLEGVQQILGAYGRRFDSVDREGMLPVGARMLRIALDYDELEGRGLCGSAAVQTMRAGEGAYDPQLLEAFARLVGARSAQRVRELALARLEVGMILTDDVRARTGVLLIGRGCTVSLELLERLRNLPDGHVVEPIRVLDQPPIG